MLYGVDYDSAREIRPTQPKALADQAAHTGPDPASYSLTLA